jgi:hypothetical protein
MTDRISQICRQLEDAGEIGGWTGEFYAASGKNWKQTGMGSRYCELSRCINADTEDEEWQTVKLRVSDHATAYCREDFSIVVDDAGGPDDHKLAEVIEWLKKGTLE